MTATTKFLIVDDDTDEKEMFCEAVDTIPLEKTCYNPRNGLKTFMALQSGEMKILYLIF